MTDDQLFDLKPVQVQAGTCAADPAYTRVARTPVEVGKEWAITPFCSCSPPGRGFAERGDGTWGAACCLRVTKTVWEAERTTPEMRERMTARIVEQRSPAPEPKPHTRESTQLGPDFCRECSRAASDWVTWPCSPEKLAAVIEQAESAAERHVAIEADDGRCVLSELPRDACGHCLGVSSPEVDAVVSGKPLVDDVEAEILSAFAARRDAVSPSSETVPSATVGDSPPVGTGGREGIRMKFSNSELRRFKRCRRAWWLSYYRGLTLRKEGVGPLSLGNMVHRPLEVYYGTEGRDPAAFDWESVLAVYVEERLADPALPDHLHSDMLADYELVKIMLRGYFDYLVEEGVDSEINVLAPEREIEAFLATIGDVDVWLIGKLDVEVELKSDGRRAFIDHKTVANLTDLPKMGAKDEQFLTYGLLQRLEALAAGVEGQRYAHGGVWNMLRKVKRTATAKPPFYSRSGVTHNDDAYRNFYARVWGEVRDILAVRANLDAGGNHHSEVYPNPTRDCSWDCPFVTICPQFDDGSDVESIISTEYVQHDPYQRYIEIEKS